MTYWILSKSIKKWWCLGPWGPWNRIGNIERIIFHYFSSSEVRIESSDLLVLARLPEDLFFLAQPLTKRGLTTY